MNLTVEISLPVDNPTEPRVRGVEAGQSSWKFSTEPEDGELYFRTKVQGSFVISGDDYSWLYSFWDNFPCCAEVNVNVFSDCQGDEEAIFWPGYFNFNAVKWDHYKCTATVQQLQPRDLYDALFRVWDKSINILDNAINRIKFSAKYIDYYKYEPDVNGILRRQLPDGNKAAIDAKGTHIYTQGQRLGTVLNTLHGAVIYNSAATFIPGIASEFLSSYINPVTGYLNPVFVIMAGSDAKRPDSVTPATRCFLSLKDLLQELRVMFDAYYMIDPANGTLRIEHSSWFDEQSYQSKKRISLDLLPFSEALKIANNESVDIDKLFGVEEIVISLNPNEGPFKRGNVRFEEKCVVKNDKGEVQTNTVSTERFFTDLMAAYRSPDSVSDDSIFMAAITRVEDNQIGEIYAEGTFPLSINDPLLFPNPLTLLQFKNNSYLAAAELFKNFHRHRRSFVTGFVNSYKNEDGSYSDGEKMEMLSTKPTRRQEGISISTCCADLPLDIRAYIRTNRFPTGKLSKGIFDPAAETFTLDVVANSRCEGVSEVVEPPAPGDGCADKGSSLGTFFEPTFCTDGVTVATMALVEYFATGDCGKIRKEITKTTINTCA